MKLILLHIAIFMRAFSANELSYSDKFINPNKLLIVQYPTDDRTSFCSFILDSQFEYKVGIWYNSLLITISYTDLLSHLSCSWHIPVRGFIRHTLSESKVIQQNILFQRILSSLAVNRDILRIFSVVTVLHPVFGTFQIFD